MKKLNEPTKKWLKALRTTEREQAEGSLAVNDARCCLGILCDVAVKEGVIKKVQEGQCYLPIKVQEWVGLSTEAGDYEHKTYANWALWKDNDRGKLTFKQIAKIIAKQPKGLFKK